MHTASLNGLQLEFWRSLLAPFHDHELSTVPKRGGCGDLTYIDKRALSNRLDSVCGPHGWYPEYEATSRGYKCRLHILVPTSNDAWVWMHKEDGAGFEEMGHRDKKTGEFVPDVDNDEKSGYTNAFRRAAQDAWGIGRYLYLKGIPSFLDPNAEPPGAPSPGPRAVDPSPVPPPVLYPPAIDNGQPDHAPAPPPARPSSPAPSGRDFQIPPPGKAVFAWTKKMEEIFQTSLVNGMKREAEQLGQGSTFAEWDAGTVNAVCVRVIGYLKTLPTYRGQYDHIAAPSPDEPIEAPAPKSAPALDEPALYELRKKLATAITALLHIQLGRKPSASEMSAAFQNIAPECADQHGNLGEVPEKLAGLEDGVWLANMIAFTEKQAADAQKRAAVGDQPGDDIPF